MEISVEFFPPKTEEGAAKLRKVREQLDRIGPSYFSVTFGAGGSTRDRTRNTVAAIHAEGRKAVPHITCVDSSREQVDALIEDYAALGIRHLLALRGDLPSGSGVGELDGQWVFGWGFGPVVDWSYNQHDEYFYFTNVWTGIVMRVRHSNENRPPVAVASVSATAGRERPI